VEFGDGAVDARSETKVVGVNDEGHERQGTGCWGQGTGRPLRSAIRRATVDRRIQAGVVVHLELAVDFEAAGAGEDVVPELVEAGDEVVALLGKQGKAVAVTLAMAMGSFGAGHLFAGVEELEGQDGEPVDHEARALGVQRSRVGLSRGGGPVLRAENFRRLFHQHGVTPFGEVVAALVDAVDGALDFGNVVVGGARGAGAVFDVPEVVVGAVLGENHFEEGAVGSGEREERVGRSPGLSMPESGGGVVEGGDFDRGEGKGVGH
jgi:hypothetical protein